jgi:hypothetical protein
MRELTAEEIVALDWGDAHLSQVRWEDDGRDLVLVLHRSEGDQAELRCTWAEDFKLALATAPAQGGMALTCAGSVERLPDGRHRVLLDFANAGSLSVICNEVSGVRSQPSASG